MWASVEPFHMITSSRVNLYFINDNWFLSSFKILPLELHAKENVCEKSLDFEVGQTWFQS